MLSVTCTNPPSLMVNSPVPPTELRPPRNRPVPRVALLPLPVTRTLLVLEALIPICSELSVAILPPDRTSMSPSPSLPTARVPVREREASSSTMMLPRSPEPFAASSLLPESEVPLPETVSVPLLIFALAEASVHGRTSLR